MLGFLDAGVSVAYHLVTGLVHFRTPVAGWIAVPAAIVAFTIAVRLLLLPLSYSALRGQAAPNAARRDCRHLGGNRRRRISRRPENWTGRRVGRRIAMAGN